MQARIERFFLSRYDSEREIVRKRNMGLLALLLAVIPTSIALIILIPTPTLQIALAAMGAVALALVAMLKAGLALPANIATTFLMSGLLAAMCFLQPFREGSEIYSIAAYESMLITVAGLIALRDYQMIGIFAIGAAGVLLDYFLRIVPGGMGQDNLNNLIICLLLLATATLMGRGIMRRGDLLLGLAEAEAEKNEGQVKALQSVIRSSENALGMGKDVRESSERTRGRIAKLKELSAAAAHSLAAFTDTAALISASNREVALAADTVRERISDQSSIVTQSSSAIEEMTASVSSIERIASARLQSMDQLKEATVAGTGAMDRASESVRAMSASMASIGEIVKVIRKVASQTNLLAMNAAIEAAHAGDSGSGFSVVAGEIRKLSEETARQVKLIDGSIKETIASVQTAMDITGGARRTFDRISAEAETVAKAMSEIGDGLGQIAAGSGEILSGVTESVAITNTVREAAGTVDDRIEVASRNLEVLATAGTAVREAMAEFAALLDELLGEAEIMASSGLASESGLRGLAETLAAFDKEGAAAKTEAPGKHRQPSLGA